MKKVLKNNGKSLKLTTLGFTLIELLGVLIILAIIALITFPIIDNVLTSSREQAYERSIDGIIEASRMYVTSQGIVPDTNTKQLSLQTLINSGFLEDKDIIDPRNNESMTGCVAYRWDNSTNQYKYQYSEECIMTTPEECFTYEVISDFTYDINYNGCMTFFNFMEDFKEISEDICDNSSDSGYSIENFIYYGLFTYEELQQENVINNLEEIEGIEITGYDSTCGGVDVVLPKSIDGKDIVSIGAESFGNGPDAFIDENDEKEYNLLNNEYIENYIINSIDLSQATKLKVIGYAAFTSNLLTSVTFPDSIKYIGGHAFANNLLKEIKLPNSIMQIEYGVFSDNQLTSVTIPDNIYYIGDLAFDNNQLTSVIISNNVIEIGGAAFANNQLTSVTIPNNVTSILGGAFENNQLTNVLIPDSVTSIGASAFANNLLTNVVLSKNIEEISSLSFAGNPWYDDNNEEFFIVNNIFLKYNGDSSEIIIPNDVKIISDHVLANKDITSVTISDGVTYIGIGSFRDNQLTSVSIPNSVTYIAAWSFQNNQLTSVTIPNSVKEIWSEAFSKSATSNPNLTNIINKTGRSFNWGTIINGTSNYYFETGTVVNSYGNVEITK